MTLTIDNTEDFIRALRENPEFRAAARRELLTQDLIELPQEFRDYRSESDRRFQRVQDDLQRMRDDLNALRGHSLELQMPSSLRQRVERRLRLTRVRNIWSGKVAIQPPSIVERFARDVEKAVDDGIVQDGEDGRLLDTDMIIRGRRGDQIVYIAVEASGVINDEDINRARESAAILRRIYSTETIPAVYGYSIAGPQLRLARADDEAAREGVLIFLDEST